MGDSSVLAYRLLSVFYGNIPQRNHPLSMPKGDGACVQAHHLICSESMNNNVWARICSSFGYNINCKENGVFLPADMRVACQLHIPLHRGNHSETQTGIKKVNYVEAVRAKIEPVREDAMQGLYCQAEEKIFSHLNRISKKIWGNVQKFKWTLTYDGFDYDDGGKGCFGERGLRRKKEKERNESPNLSKKRKRADCPDQRKHKILVPHWDFPEQK